MEIKELKEHIEGLRARRDALNNTRDEFIKVNGIDIDIAKHDSQLTSLKADSEKTKKELKDLQLKKAQSLMSTCEALSKKMGEVLPDKVATIEIDEESGSLSIGVDGDHFNSLSGGVRAGFDIALAHAIGANVLIMEAAEKDGSNLVASLLKLKGVDDQVFINSHIEGIMVDGFQTITLSRKDGKDDRKEQRNNEPEG